jgi:hypothetical protein
MATIKNGAGQQRQQNSNIDQANKRDQNSNEEQNQGNQPGQGNQTQKNMEGKQEIKQRGQFSNPDKNEVDDRQNNWPDSKPDNQGSSVGREDSKTGASEVKNDSAGNQQKDHSTNLRTGEMVAKLILHQEIKNMDITADDEREQFGDDEDVDEEDDTP